MKVFAAAPFLRILLPFAAGILTALHTNIPVPPLLWLLVPLLVMAVALLKANKLPGNKVAFMAATDFFLFFYGLRLVELGDLSKDPLYYGNYIQADTSITYIGVVKELPVQKANHVKLSLGILKLITGKNLQDAEGNLIAYVKQSQAARAIEPGNLLLIKSKLINVEGPANPGEFDYRAYLSDRQIYHTAFIDSSAFSVLPLQAGLNPVWALGLRIKAFVIRRLESGGLSTDAFAICSALLTGHDDDLDRDIVDAFAHSGTLHVLSVSGLHTGLIFLVLNFLFDRFDRKQLHKRSRFVLITVFLWFFALVTGFAAPVLRAVIMFNLLGLGNLFFRSTRSNHLNLLLVSAFILLLYNPFLLHDLGFLLSYSAMAGLICLQPVFSRLWQPRMVFVNYIWQSITASAAATISTLPLTLFFFKQFPLWFFICNIVVVPLSFLILLLAAVVVLSPWLIPLLINKLVEFLVAFISLFDSGTYGYISDINFGFIDLLVLTVLIFLVYSTIQQRSARLAAVTLGLVIGWQIFGLLDSWEAKNKKLFVVYQAGKKSIYAIKNRSSVRMVKTDENAFRFHARPHLVSFSRPEVIETPFNYVQMRNASVLLLNEPGKIPHIDPQKITTLVVCNDFRLDSVLLKKFSKLRNLVADGSNARWKTRALGELCRKFGIDFYDTRSSGAFLMAVQ